MTPTASDSEASPSIILVQCPGLTDPLADRGIDTTEVAALDALTRRGHGLHGHVIVAHASAFEPVGSLSDTVGRVRRAFPLVDVLIWAPDGQPAFVREALVSGVRDVLLTSSADHAAKAAEKILDAQQIMPRASELGYEEKRDSEFHGMLARSRRMWDLFDTAARIAATEAPVLILGETGTGKELLARAVHRLSGRDGQFVPVNCAAIAESLVDSELFGHVKGAFTGALREKVGLFRHADRGTLMLDEIGHISLSAQHRLLRAVQEGAVRPVGGHDEVPVDVRIIAATSRSLERDVERGRFREDLFYRLDVIRLEVPPLRDRPEDILFLFGHFARELALQYDLPKPEVTDSFIDAMLRYPWPGNVRQLENVTERLLLTHTSGPLRAEELARLGLAGAEPRDGQQNGQRNGRPNGTHATPRVLRTPLASVDDDAIEIDTSVPMKDALEPHTLALERLYLEACLQEERGRVGRVAERAGISRRTLLRKMIQHGIDKRDFKD